MKALQLLFVILIFSSCNQSNEDIFFNKSSNMNLLKRVTINENTIDEFKFDIGIWLFKNQNKNPNDIANWIGVKHENKTILEPINVIWIDLTSTNKEEATYKILQFLKSNNLQMRDGSSIGYSALFDNDIWISQYGKTWSDNSNPLTINNHGRIFLANKVIFNNKLGYISSAAFSVENEKHYLVSFHNAISQIKETEKWSIYNKLYNLENIINDNNITTYDHKGTKIFISK